MTIAIIIVAAIALALAVAALATSRHWLVLPAALLVLAGIAVAVPLDVPDAWPAVVVAVLLAAVGVLGGSPLVRLILRFAQGGVELGAHGGIVVDDPGGEAGARRREILRGGATIGYLERFALIGAVIAGQAGAVAIIVAVKGLGRFSELEDSAARERFIIGTLTSLAWAGACAAAIVLLT